MSKKPINQVLLVEDNPGDARLLREMFDEQGSHGTKLTIAQSMDEAEKYLTEHTVDIVLLDLGLPDVQGLDAVRRAHAAAPRIPLVVLTGLDDETLAARALQEGAQDYLVKSQIDTYGTTRGLVRALRYSIERKILEDALFVEKERAQVTLNSIGDAVACTDVSGNLTFLNLVAEKLTGWSLQEAAGLWPTFSEFLTPRIAKSFLIRWIKQFGVMRPCICRRTPSSSGGMDSKSRSKTPSLPFTTVKGRPPERSSFSAT